MTQETALDILTRVDNRRTYFVHSVIQRHVRARGESTVKYEYTVSVFYPFPNYSNNLEQFSGFDLSEVIARAVSYLKAA